MDAAAAAALEQALALIAQGELSKAQRRLESKGLGNLADEAILAQLTGKHPARKEPLPSPLSEEVAARRVWLVFLGCFGLILVGSAPGLVLFAVLGFVALNVAEGLWRPVVISRFDQHGLEEQGATLLSIESQARSLATVILAPLVGGLIDVAQDAGLSPQLPIAALGLTVGLTFVLLGRRRAVAP